MTMPGWFCTADGCTEQAAARVGVPLLPYPPGVGLGFALIYPLTEQRGVTGMPLCVDHTHHAVDQMLMAARPGPEGAAA